MLGEKTYILAFDTKPAVLKSLLTITYLYVFLSVLDEYIVTIKLIKVLIFCLDLLNKSTILQSVVYRILFTSYLSVSRRSRVRIPLKSWFFQASSFQLLNCDDHSSLSSTTAVHIWNISYKLHIIIIIIIIIIIKVTWHSRLRREDQKAKSYEKFAKYNKWNIHCREKRN